MLPTCPIPAARPATNCTPAGYSDDCAVCRAQRGGGLGGDGNLRRGEESRVRWVLTWQAVTEQPNEIKVMPDPVENMGVDRW